MTRITGDPADFARDAIAGLCDAHPDLVRAVDGGVVRATATRPGKVAVVLGGGAGHYPAFAGYVGPGLADGAVCGDVFASPSSRQVVDVARLADQGAGVLLCFGNYAGDVLNFGLAADRLRSSGIPTEVVAVSDDVASAPPDRAWQRRGVAGDVVVAKVAGAAAETEADLDEVSGVARAANDATRSLGVAFAGCTPPGAREPLFTVPPGRMGVGLGIHGEPGITEREVLRAGELADLLVAGVVAEAPADAGSRAAVLVNGLGATGPEELLVLWAHLAPRLRTAGLEPVAPRVGTLVSSLDLAGCSLTVAWLDPPTEALWTAPCWSPAMTVGAVAAAGTVSAPPVPHEVERPGALPPPVDPAGRDAADRVVAVLRAVAAALAAAEDDLGRLDAIAGDGDHGRGMARGSAAALAAAEAAAGDGSDVPGGGAAWTLGRAADAWADRAGGTSGALWGGLLRTWATELSDGPVAAGAVVRGARAGLAAVTRLGGARVGDKTLVDALVPFVDALESRSAAGDDLAAAWAAAARDSVAAVHASAALEPRLGRARPLAARSVGHPDAGAASLALCATAAAPVLAGGPTRDPAELAAEVMAGMS
jgi:dihydroxyacetone kinase